MPPIRLYIQFMPRNPYLNRVAIQDPRQFYGRRKEISKIFSRLSSSRPQSISIVGDRRIGKSSLLHYINSETARAVYLDTPKDYIFLFLDLQQRRDMSMEDFFRKFFAPLKRQLPEEEAEYLEQVGADFDSVRALLERLHERNWKLIILLDEFDAITTNNKFSLDFYSFLRSIANNYNVAYVTSSGRDLQELCHTHEIADSPFFNIFTTIYLRAFSQREAVELIAQPSQEAEVSLRPYADQIISMAGLFPFYLQIACSTFFDFLQAGGELDDEGKREIEDAFLDEVTVHFHYTWSHFTEDERRVINDFVAGREIKPHHGHIFKSLKRDGYIIDTEHGERVFSDLFVRAISSLRESSMTYLDKPQSNLPPTEPVNYNAPEMKVELARSLKRFIENEGKLGHFDIIRRLSEGGMGRIYEARDSRLQRRVVIKVLSERFAKNDVVKKRFLREAQTASQLLHPNIAAIFETGEAMGVPYIVMEYVTGENLGEILMKRQFTIAEVINIATQAAEALSEAHDHEERIVHRDIKPGNIMLTEKGQVKVLDFGLAKPSPLGRIAEASPKLDLTEEGMVIGTVRYMSPEQASGKRDLDARSDIFSLGILLYEITTGFVPFKGESYLDVIEEIKGHEPTAIDSLREDAPPQLAAIIMKCLCKNPDDRYQSAAEITKDLKKVRIDTEAAK